MGVNPTTRGALSKLRLRLGAWLLERISAVAPARRQRFGLIERVLGARIASGPTRILDAGCGDGRFATALAERHPEWRVVGVDLREEMLRTAREHARRRGIANVRFLRADLTQPLPEHGFDVVLAIECIVEIPDDAAALAAMAGALAPGGLFIAHAPERAWRAILPGSPSTWRDQVRQGYGEDELRKALTDAGLEAIAIEPTYRGTVMLAQELADRVPRSQPALRALVFLALSCAVPLERHGVTWGRGHAWLAVARRPTGGS